MIHCQAADSGAEVVTNSRTESYVTAQLLGVSTPRVSKQQRRTRNTTVTLDNNEQYVNPHVP